MAALVSIYFMEKRNRMERKVGDFMNALSTYTTVLSKGEINTELAQAIAQYKLAHYKIKYSLIFSLTKSTPSKGRTTSN